MKIALVISGQPRMVNEAYNNIKLNFLDPYSPDVFIHTWVNPEDFSKSTKNSWGSGNFTYDQNIVGNIYSKYLPKKSYFENQIDLTSSLPKSLNKKYHFNMASMLYSMDKANSLKTSYEIENNFIYDCVIRYRFDLNIFCKEPIKLNELDLSNTIYCLNDCSHYNGVNDQFAIGNSKNIDIFSSSYKNIKEFSKNYKNHCQLVCGETIVYYSTWLKNQITLDYIPYDYTLLR